MGTDRDAAKITGEHRTPQDAKQPGPVSFALSAKQHKGNKIYAKPYSSNFCAIV